MDISKGGRGKKADYETTHARIPVALKELVTTLSNEYKLTGTVPSLHAQPTLLDIMTKDEAIADIRQPSVYSLENLLRCYIFAPKGDITSSEIAEIVGHEITIEFFNKLSENAQRHFIGKTLWRG